MYTALHWIGVAFIGASFASSRVPSRNLTPAPACATDPNYQRLAFWVGDWEVVDSVGAHYATQRVHAVLDNCAVVAEWTGRVGDKGLNVSSFDGRAGEWRQVYLSNQVPAPSGVSVRRSDPSYTGPGIRFIALVDPPSDVRNRSRVTLFPIDGNHVMQLFEDSNDGGATWTVIFRAEHRRLTSTSGTH